jgi:amino acid adenylation domain-containing protein
VRFGDEAVVVSATGAVSLLNYAYTLILLWMLPTREFAEAGSISALLLICGTIAGAALPWVLAQEVLRAGPDRTRRRLAVSFCLFATVLQGAGAGVATCLIVVHYAHGWVLPASFAAAFMIFMGATATGFFQGQQRFRLIAVLKVSEVVVKIATGVALIALGAGASGAVVGFALGATVVVVVGVASMARDFQWSWRAVAGRHLWAATQGLMAIQVGVALLASMDVVIGSLVLGTTPALATYQAANILGRIPVFIGSALSIVVFPRLIAARRHPRAMVRESLVLYAMLCVPIALGIASMPATLVDGLFPSRYGDVGAILPWSALGGLMMGAVNLTTTYFQATGHFRRTTTLLTFGVALCAGLEVSGLRLGGVVGLAVAVAVGGAVVTAVLLREAARVWPGVLHGTWRPCLIAVAGCLPLLLLRHHLVVWCVWVVGCGLHFCLRSLLRLTSGGTPDGSGRPRVLHLGYEDPRRPGAGGGSVRTHEINRRLAADFDITVVCARYRGARPRVEDGVRYVHAGVPGADFPERLTYFAALPLVLLRYPSDVVVEDFGAPFSSVAVPWMTGRPVVGVVQWLFAREKSLQYHLPFHWVEALGVRSHRAMIAVSDDLGAALAARNPSAEVTVVANGLDAAAFEHYDRERTGIAYLGRLEIAQKGLDLLIEAYARIAGAVDQDLFLAGDGPDRPALVELAGELGVGDRVHFVGRVDAADRFAWLAGADLVAMPSRYETFGMVAAEALAVGTPVVAFDIPCLRALVDADVGARVPAFDVGAFAEAVRALAVDAGLRRRLGDRGPERVGDLRWDELARQQADVYRRHLTAGPWTTDADGPHHLDGGRSRSVVERFTDQLAATPDRVAVVDGDVRWTYEQLDQAAATVARMLVGAGFGPGDTIGVCLPRSKEAIAAMFGVWMAGGTYLPLDPDHPPARLAGLCRRAGVPLVIGRSPGLVDAAPALRYADVTIVAPTARGRGGRSVTHRSPAPETLAYILFTSGSSGRPKGVQVTHRSLATVLDWLHDTVGPEELAVTTTSVPFGFDPFIIEVLGPLLAGGRVHVIPTALALGDVGGGVTLVANTPSVLAELLRAGRLPSTLRTIVVGGEVLSAALAGELLAREGSPRLVNTYGPTEATVLATAVDVTLPVAGPVPIGRELPGARVLLLDDDLHRVGPGGQGEICLHGPQLSEGYLGDPDETAARFGLWSDDGGAPMRIYRTGDIGRYGDDGLLYFCGRVDRQLKLRGFRIEPAEVEAALACHPDVGQAVVSGVGTGPRAHLVAHVTTRSPGVTPADLKAWLASRLPGHLVPDRFVLMETLPTTANGKVAVELLPEWRPTPHRPSDGVGAVEPRGERTVAGADEQPGVRPQGLSGEQSGDRAGDAVATVARLARAVLDIDGAITGDDDVLEDLGGTSLALFQLLTAIEQEFSCRIEIGRILSDTTIAGLAALVAAGAGERALPPPADAPSGQPVYMIHAYLGTALNYRRLGPFLGRDRSLVGIQVQRFDGGTGTIRTSIEEMADDAIDQILARQAVGPYVLGGHSAGGLVAYEASRRLAAAGHRVSLVILLDTPVPRSSLHYLWAEAVLNWPDVRAADTAERIQQVRGALFRRFGHLGRGPDPDRVRGAITRSYRAINLAVKHYHPRPYAGDVAVMRTRQGATMALGQPDLGWGDLVQGSVLVSEIPGLHNTILEGPQLEVVGHRIDELVAAVGWPSPPGEVRRPPRLRSRPATAGRRRTA